MPALSTRIAKFYRKAFKLGRNLSEECLPIKEVVKLLSQDAQLEEYAHKLLSEGGFIRLLKLLHQVNQYHQHLTATLAQQIEMAFNDPKLKNPALQSIYIQHWQDKIVSLFFEKGLPHRDERELRKALKDLWDVNAMDLRRKALDKHSVDASSRSAIVSSTRTLSWMLAKLSGLELPLLAVTTGYSLLSYIFTVLKEADSQMASLETPKTLTPALFGLLLAQFPNAKAAMQHLAQQTQVYLSGVEDAQSMNVGLKGGLTVAMTYGLQHLAQGMNMGIAMATLFAQHQILKKIDMNTEEHPMQPALDAVTTYLDEKNPPSYMTRFARLLR